MENIGVIKNFRIGGSSNVPKIFRLDAVDFEADIEGSGKLAALITEGYILDVTYYINSAGYLKVLVLATKN